jgi:hypothetical protein
MAQTSAQRKLLRGIEQLQTLGRETEAFVKGDAYVFRTEPEPRSAHEVAYHTFATERQAPCDDWPLIAGESIQNMRSALDHAVWRVWKNVSSNTGDGDHTQFPIAIDCADFRSQAGRMLLGIPAPIKTLIEDTQPYRRHPPTPALDALYKLRTLSNIDKHRTLATVAVSVQHEFVGSPADVMIHWEEYGTNRVLGHGETKVSVFIATSERDISGMEMEPGFAYEVRIEGEPVKILEYIARRVFEAVSACETGNALTPFAAYPI